MSIADKLFEVASSRFVLNSADDEIDLRILCDRQVDLAFQGKASPRFDDMLEAVATL